MDIEMIPEEPPSIYSSKSIEEPVKIIQEMIDNNENQAQHINIKFRTSFL